MELPVSNTPLVSKSDQETGDDGWNNNWGDDWGDGDEEQPNTPVLPLTPSVSSRGLAPRRLSKEGWKDQRLYSAFFFSLLFPWSLYISTRCPENLSPIRKKICGMLFSSCIANQTTFSLDFWAFTISECDELLVYRLNYSFISLLHLGMYCQSRNGAKLIEYNCYTLFHCQSTSYWNS